jgi:4-aminobutyrate aminotransferase-like enzyme
LTDSPGYRQGQPVYGEVTHLPFYDPEKGLEKSLEATLSILKDQLTRYPDKFAALLIEPIQGEGGFVIAPKEYYVRLFEECRKAKLAIWLDEIQTFGRTGEYFAFQKLGIGEYVDVVTIGKMLHACMVLYTEEYNPKPGLVAGTFSGSAAALRTGRRVLELLEEGNYLGPEGRIEKLSAYFASKLTRLAEGTCKGRMGEIRAIGGMIGFVPHDGTMDSVKTVLMKLFDIGVVAFYCGHGPYLIRMLPPLGAMTEADIDLACSYIERALLETAPKSGDKK